MHELLGVPAEKVYDERLYRALDKLLPHKEALETYLKHRLGELFTLEYDLLLYDVTSTYFEGEANRNPMAQRGYSRDKRSDCKQVCIGLVVSKCGMPLGYKVFNGNRTDVTTLKEIVETMERRYGKADRIWVGDRGMMSKKNIEFLKSGDRRYIIGASKGYLYLRGEYYYLLEALQQKLHKRRDAGLLGNNIAGQQDFDFDIEIHLGAGAYICGEESALIESLEGKRGIPRKRPPFPVTHGFRDQPTVVNNVETFIAAAKIAVFGADWFRSVGTDESAGTKLLSISGDCMNRK